MIILTTYKQALCPVVGTTQCAPAPLQVGTWTATQHFQLGGRHRHWWCASSHSIRFKFLGLAVLNISLIFDHGVNRLMTLTSTFNRSTFKWCHGFFLPIQLPICASILDLFIFIFIYLQANEQNIKISIKQTQTQSQYSMPHGRRRGQECGTDGQRDDGHQRLMSPPYGGEA